MRCSASILALALLSAGSAFAQPPLPRLALSTYPPAARDAIERAHANATEHARDGDAVGSFARVLHAWEQWDSAHEAYIRAQALAPSTFEWLYLDALVLQRLARAADAVMKLKAALVISPEYLPARLKLAEALLDAGELDQSEPLFTSLTDPACEPAVQFGLGRIAAARGHHDVAVEHLQRAIALFPEFGAAHYALALSYRALGKRDEAMAEMDKHTQYGARWPALADPVFATVTSLRDDAGALLQRGIKLADAGDVDGAIAAHEQALAVDPSLVQAHANLISLYGRVHNWSKAEEHYRAVVAANVNVADAHYDYGVLLGMQEKWDLAGDAYRKAIALNPLHAQAHNNLGQILERERKLEEAAAEYTRAVESQPTLRLARFNLGRMLIALGRTDQAIVELQKLTEPLDAEAPRYLFALSVAHHRAGHKDEALKWGTEARSLALKYGDTELAAAIDRDLASIK
jgi:tetratricopeptide (TPR) repeat protein